MFCPNCGKEVSDKERFCGNCGKQIVSVTSEKTARQPQKEASRRQPTRPNRMPQKMRAASGDPNKNRRVRRNNPNTLKAGNRNVPDGGKNNKKVALIVGIAIFAAIVAIVLIALIVNQIIGENDSSDSTMYMVEGNDLSTDDTKSGNGLIASEATTEGTDDLNTETADMEESSTAASSTAASGTEAQDTEKVETTEAYSEVGIHKYELIVGDYTWQEAFNDCILKGGYLVRINSQEEWDYIVSMLDAQKGEACYFYIGGSRTDNSSSYYWMNEQGELYGDILNDRSFWGYDLWLDGEPSFADEDVTETKLAILYQKSAKRYVLNDIANSVLQAESYLSGKIGYICEYE